MAESNSISDTKKNYWAFISYRHADNKEQDREWASWLHREIEQYEVPAELIGTTNERGIVIPERIYPVFRDEESLPADASLADSIGAALDMSEFLVVLCSPQAVESLYVAQEIDQFKNTNKSNYIITGIISGEPGHPTDECFPTPLRDLKSAEGKLIEPIAADFRLPNGSEGFTSSEAYRKHLLNQKLPTKQAKRKAEAYDERLQLMKLKIIAGILGVPLETLRNRDKAYQLAKAKKRQRFLTGVIATVSVLAILAFIAGFIALQQKQQADLNATEASLQKSVAEDKTEEAKKQKRQADKNADEAENQRDLAIAAKSELNEKNKTLDLTLETTLRFLPRAGVCTSLYSSIAYQKFVDEANYPRETITHTLEECNILASALISRNTSKLDSLNNDETYVPTYNQLSAINYTKDLTAIEATLVTLKLTITKDPTTGILDNLETQLNDEETKQIAAILDTIHYRLADPNLPDLKTSEIKDNRKWRFLILYQLAHLLHDWPETDIGSTIEQYYLIHGNLDIINELPNNYCKIIVYEQLFLHLLVSEHGNG